MKPLKNGIRLTVNRVGSPTPLIKVAKKKLQNVSFISIISACLKMDEKKENIVNQLFTGREDLTTLPTLFGEFIVLMNTPSVSPRKVAELIKKIRAWWLK
jgi:hypothetical protein